MKPEDFLLSSPRPSPGKRGFKCYIFVPMILLSAFSDWFNSQSLLEVAGVITGLLCVFLAARNVIWNWPVAIISVAIYIVIFFEAKLYADMGLQVYFMIMNIYGWYYWSNHAKTGMKKEVGHIKGREILFSILATTVFTVVLGFTLFHQTDASFPFLDSFCTACSIVAQVFLARKVIENWLIWIFVDIIYVGIYLAKDLHLTAVMYGIYVIIAAMGYIEWRKEFKIQQAS